MNGARAVGLVLGFALDRVIGDPRRGHPVAAFGRVAGALEQRTWADDRAAGARYTATLVGGTALLGAVAERRVPRVLATAAATWAVLGGRTLGVEARAVHAHLDRDDLPAAREQVTHLVGRDPSELGPDEIARATVESVAENTSDAVVAPLLWGAVAGVPGLLGYRAANTLDAMVGHRTPRHLRFGWASARLDDLLNLVPARAAALLAALLGDRPGDALRAWERDAPGHPSPNAGPVEAAFAGSLGVTLGGTNHYASGTEHRVEMGTGPAPVPADIPRTVALADRVGLGALTLACLVALSRKRGSRWA